MPYISSTWCNLCNAGAVFHVNGRIDYYSLEHAPEVILPEEFYYDTINFTEDNILEGSFRFSASLNQGGEVTAGGMVTSSVSFALVNYDGALDFSGYKAQRFRGRVCLQIYTYNAGGNPVYLDLPVYYISSFKDNNGLIMIEGIDALDWMNARADSSIGGREEEGYEVMPDVMADNICLLCQPAPGGEGHKDGVEAIVTTAISYTRKVKTTNLQYGSTTYAEVMRHLAELCGTYLNVEVNAGSAPLYGDPPDQEIVRPTATSIPITADAVISSEILGTQQHINWVRVYDYLNPTVYADSTTHTDQRIYVAGNPFIFGDRLALDAENIRTELSFLPSLFCNFELVALCNPAIRPGDTITFVDHGTTYTSVVASVDWTLGDYMTLSCAPQEQQTIEQSTPTPEPSPEQPEVVPVEVETETITGVSSSLVTVYQYEGVVSVDVEITLTAAISNLTLLASGLPAPIWTSRTEEVLYGTSYTRPLRFVTNTSGELSIRYGAAGTYYHHFTYLTNDGATPVTYPDADEEEF